VTTERLRQKVEQSGKEWESETDSGRDKRTFGGRPEAVWIKRAGKGRKALWPG